MKKIILFSLVFILNSISTARVMAQECSDNIVYVNPKFVNDTGMTIQKWIELNPNMVLCKNGVDEIIVDLGNFKNENDIPIWLKENSGYIDYDKSFPLIEKAHLLSKNDPIYAGYIKLADDEIMVNKNYFGLAFQDLKIGLNDVDISQLAPSEYYKNYKRAIDKNFIHGVKLKSTNGFIINGHNFSTPLFLSILKKLEIGFGKDVPNEELEKQGACFFQFTFINKDTKAIMKVTYNNEILYYDFSDEPGGAKILKNDENLNMIKKSL